MTVDSEIVPAMPDLRASVLCELDVADDGAAGFQGSAKGYSELIRDPALWYQAMIEIPL